MHLAGHADPKTHMKYVRQTPEMRHSGGSAAPSSGCCNSLQFTSKQPNQRESEGGQRAPDDDAKSP